MFIRCSDNCAHQKDGICNLRNVYSSELNMNRDDIDKTGCIYYKEKIKKKKTYEYPTEFENRSRWF